MSSHAENMGVDGELQNCPIMPTYAAPNIMFIREKVLNCGTVRVNVT